MKNKYIKDKEWKDIYWEDVKKLSPEEIKKVKLILKKEMNKNIGFGIKVCDANKRKFGIALRTFKTKHYLMVFDEYIIGKRSIFLQIHIGDKYIMIGRFEKGAYA